MFKSLLCTAICVVAFCLVGSTTTPASPTDSRELFAPVFVNRPSNLGFYHCDTARYTFQAVSAATGLPSMWVRYFVVSGPGSIDSVTGEWKLPPVLTPDSIGTYSLEIGATELGVTTEGLQNCHVRLYVQSYVTYLRFTDAGFNGRLTLQASQTGVVNFEYVSRYGCDSSWAIFDEANPEFTGQIQFHDNYEKGFVAITPDSLDAGKTFHVRLATTNRFDTAFTSFIVEVLPLPQFAIRIQSVRNQLQGQFMNLPVTLEKHNNYGSAAAFDLLIAYDNSALSLQSVVPGVSLYDTCKWEYFTYRFGANGNCSGGCPSGLVRVVGLAETNNGDFHPSCYVGDSTHTPFELFKLHFLVSSNRTFPCQHIPVQFFWIDCGDNTLASRNGDSLLLEARTFYRDSLDTKDIKYDSAAGVFPGYAGTPSGVCSGIGPYITTQVIDFYGGMVDIVCAESIDARGDINVNSISYEVADFVALEDYFLYGTSAFGNHVAASLAASDINADGSAAKISDLVYLARVVKGDALPYPRGTHLDSAYTTPIHIAVHDGVISHQQGSAGAFFLVVEGTVVPSLLQPNLTLGYSQQNDTTRIVVCPSLSSDTSEIFAGPFLQLSPAARVLSGEASTVGGEQLNLVVDEPTGTDENAAPVPREFALLQNYPNPFNAGTLIQFDLPRASDVRLEIINILGQTVWETSNHYSAGTQRINWNGTRTDGSAVSSGVYYYRLTAGSFVRTRKMVILK
jgi:hypothetical protein